VQLEEGDAVLLLTGLPHVVRAHSRALVLDVHDVVARATPTELGYRYAPESSPSSSHDSTLSALTFGTRGFVNSVQRALPDVVHLRPRDLDRAARIVLEALQAECDRGREANREVLLRLGEVVCLRALERGMLGARTLDVAVLTAAAAALAALDESWSVRELAQRAGLSRSRFCERFQACFGEAPMRWLRRQRLVCAAGWLEVGACSVAQAAERLDYESEGAFRKAYRRELGKPAHVGPRVASQ
jgi:AraC-like DNA-binding protein